MLELYRAHDENVRFFVAGDRKTPVACSHFLDTVENTFYIHPARQEEWKCSELIGWNCIQRRNIALLEALRWGADVVVSIDDDNFPIKNYFKNAYQMDGKHPYAGLKASSPDGWFDVGKMLSPSASQRGFPIDKNAQPWFEPVVGARIGVCSGICMGDPDIGAATRIVNAPIVHNCSELLHVGFVVDPHDCWTIFNSQNVAILRELAPAFFMMPGVGRMDDIYASLIVQKVMQERGLVVHHGPPKVWQSRNKHDLVSDLEAELNGMRNIGRFGRFLDSIVLPGGSVIDKVRAIYQSFDSIPNSYDLVPKQAVEAALAFLDDAERLM